MVDLLIKAAKLHHLVEELGTFCGPVEVLTEDQGQVHGLLIHRPGDLDRIDRALNAATFLDPIGRMMIGADKLKIDLRVRKGRDRPQRDHLEMRSTSLDSQAYYGYMIPDLEPSPTGTGGSEHR